MLSLVYAECYIFYHYTKCRYAEYHYAKCRCTECLYAKCRYTEYHYAKCRFTECHYAECRGVKHNEWLQYICPAKSIPFLFFAKNIKYYQNVTAYSLDMEA